MQKVLSFNDFLIDIKLKNMKKVIKTIDSWSRDKNLELNIVNFDYDLG